MSDEYYSNASVLGTEVKEETESRDQQEQVQTIMEAGRVDLPTVEEGEPAEIQEKE